MAWGVWNSGRLGGVRGCLGWVYSWGGPAVPLGPILSLASATCLVLFIFDAWNECKKSVYDSGGVWLTFLFCLIPQGLMLLILLLYICIGVQWLTCVCYNPHAGSMTCFLHHLSFTPNSSQRLFILLSHPNPQFQPNPTQPSSPPPKKNIAPQTQQTIHTTHPANITSLY